MVTHNELLDRLKKLNVTAKETGKGKHTTKLTCDTGESRMNNHGANQVGDGVLSEILSQLGISKKQFDNSLKSKKVLRAEAKKKTEEDKEEAKDLYP